MISLLSYSLFLHWAFNRWLAVFLVLIAAALVVRLYRDQQTLTSRRVIVTLTTLRLLLVALMLALLAGLSARWTRASASGGTLWVLVDNSASMAQRDPRATAIEKLRWADFLGYLPDSFRASRLDRLAARLAALRADLAHLRNQGERPGMERRTQAEALREWCDRLRSLKEDISNDPEGRKPEGNVVAALQTAAQRATQATGASGVPWTELQSSIDHALPALRTLAENADQRVLAERASDPKLKEAMDKVAALPRAQLARLALATKPSAGSSLAELMTRQTTKLITFADKPQPVASDSAAALDTIAPAGESTHLAAALRHVYDHLDASGPASVVVLSDGRHNNNGDPVEPARLLASRGVRVFTVALGSEQVAADATVEQLEAPDWVYHDDTLRASALLRLDGLAGKPVTVEFYRAGTKVDSSTVTPTQDRATHVVHFTDKPPAAGIFDYEVRIGELADEAVKENNHLATRVAVRKDKLGVLVVEDMPRWEYRHLVNFLSRDQRVKLQTVLLQPARVENVTRPPPVRASPRNQGVEAQLLPQQPHEWAAFDLVVLGDVPKEALSESDQQALVAAVRDRGTTLLLIAGQFHMPQRFAGTPIEGLVPVDLSAEWPPEALAAHVKGGFTPEPAPEGRTSILSQFTLDEAANGSLWSALPPWYWHSAFTTARRSAAIVWTIADATSTDDVGARDRALLCTMSVGMGRVMYLASDSTWRMRQVGGQNPHERFWGQVIRWVVDNELPAGGKLVRFGTDKPRYVAGERVVVTARLLGDDFAPLAGQKVKVVARGDEAKEIAQAGLSELPDAPGYYRATLGGLPAGRVELSLQGEAAERLLAADPAVTQKSLSVDVQSQLSVEQRNVNADRATMRRIGEAGGGVCLEGPYADILAAHVPKLNYATERVEQVGMFTAPTERYASLSHWLFLTAFIVLASAEWIIRKAAGLV